MFSRDKTALEQEITELQKKLRQVTHDYEQLKLNRKVEEDEIKHLMKISKDNMEIENEKWKIKQEREFAAQVEQIREEYKLKVEKLLESRNEDMRSMYSEVLDRLPNVNMRINDRKTERVENYES